MGNMICLSFGNQCPPPVPVYCAMAALRWLALAPPAPPRDTRRIRPSKGCVSDLSALPQAISVARPGSAITLRGLREAPKSKSLDPVQYRIQAFSSAYGVGSKDPEVFQGGQKPRSSARRFRVANTPQQTEDSRLLPGAARRGRPGAAGQARPARRGAADSASGTTRRRNNAARAVLAALNGASGAARQTYARPGPARARRACGSAHRCAGCAA